MTMQYWKRTNLECFFSLFHCLQVEWRRDTHSPKRAHLYDLLMDFFISVHRKSYWKLIKLILSRIFIRPIMSCMWLCQFAEWFFRLVGGGKKERQREHVSMEKKEKKTRSWLWINSLPRMCHYLLLYPITFRIWMFSLKHFYFYCSHILTHKIIAHTL